MRSPASRFRLAALGWALWIAAAFVAGTQIAPAFAGEDLIGTIIVSDGGTSTNRTTGWQSYACPANATGGCFDPGQYRKLTVQCDQASWFGTGITGCDAGRCLKLAADEKFPTSTGANQSLVGHAFNSDGGVTAAGAPAVTYYGGWLATSPVSGSDSVCRVFVRNGNE